MNKINVHSKISMEQCVGCSACYNACPVQCISMEKDENGFSYPKVKNEKCMECGRCLSSCPLVNYKKREQLPVAFAAFTQNNEIRDESSSGGIFTEIARWVLKHQGIVYGASYNLSGQVRHICIEQEENLWKVRGAKYSESRLENSFSEILDALQKEKYVLFSGTPCQVAGLKSFLKKDYKNLISMDFVCHGIPSPTTWNEYLKLRVKEDGENKIPSYINMRSKITGWSRYQYSHHFHYDQGKDSYCINKDSLFMKLFVGDYINRRACESCLFKGYSRVSDFTVGDFWGIWDIDVAMDDNRGTSVVLLHSPKAMEIWREIKKDLVVKEVTLEQVSQQNPSVLNSSKANKRRDDVLCWIREGQLEKCYGLFNPKERKRILKRIIEKIKLIQKN